MLSDSDDEDDHKAQPSTSKHSATSSQPSGAMAGPAVSAGMDGKSKLLLLKMASEFVEAAALASVQTPTPTQCMSAASISEL